MRLVRTRLGGGLFVLASAVTAALVVVACATGTDGVLVDDDGGAGDVDGAKRDVNVLPGRDSSTPEDGATPPGDDGGGGSCTQKIVINELQTRTAAGAAVEFIELYNPNTCAVPMGGWDIGYKSSAGNGNGIVYTFGTGDSIAAKSFLLLGSSTFPGTKDATFAAGFSGMADDGQIALRDDTAKVVDAVGFGSATGVFVESNAAPSPTTTSSVGRKADGVDSDNNASDFKLLSPPSPRAAN